MLWSFLRVVTVLLLLKFISSKGSSNYSKDALVQRYPDYGTKWMYFPDGDGIPRVVYLEMPSNDSPDDFPSADDIKKSMTFRLYTRKVKNGTFLSAASRAVLRSEFDPKKATKFVTHGWISSGKSDVCMYIKDAFLAKEDVNVIVVDWSSVADNIFYPIPMAHTKDVGKGYAEFIDKLIEENGADPAAIHLIGHSLGAHVSGFAGRSISKGKVARITGLDPALPGFNREFKSNRLLPSDAEFVDVIHTCGGVLGVLYNLGHADFYPNGGVPPQPGCGGLTQIIEACSHGRSWKYFAESVISSRKFMSQRCKTWDNFLTQSCDHDRVPMGNPTPTSARGTYFLTTEDSPPYAKVKSAYTVLGNNIDK